MDEEQEREVARIAELETRRYFDQYLKEVFPQQMTRMREHTHLMIRLHNESDKAHGGVEETVKRARWMIAGAIAVAGAAGGGVAALLKAIAGV